MVTGRGVIRTLALGGITALACTAVGVGALAGCVRLRAAPWLRTVADVPPVDVCLVLGAQVYPDGRPSSFLRNRLDLAVALHRAGKIKVIIVSGEQSQGYDEPGTMRNYLVQQGIPAGQIVIDPAGLDTYDSCIRARDVFGVDTVVVVTQSYHLYRAVTICRALGLTVYGVGDRGARARADTWRRGVRRELGANVKMVWDVCTRRVPDDLGPPDSAVTRALAELQP